MKNITPTSELFIVYSIPFIMLAILIIIENTPKIINALKEKSKKTYNNMCYDSWFDKSFKSPSFIIPLLLLRTKTFWFIIFLIIPTIMMDENVIQTPLTSLYISLNAAGLFYLVFNLIPEIKQKCQAARQASVFIFSITSTRASIMNELTGRPIFTEANRIITEDLFKEIGSKLRGAYFDPNNRPHINTNNIFAHQIPIQAHTRINYNNAQNIFDVLNQVVEIYTSLIEKIKNITYIEKLELYNSVCFLEGQINEFKTLRNNNFFPVTEIHLIAYILSAPDKLNYYAQNELPRYVGDRFNLRIKLSKEEVRSARKLQVKHYS